MGFESRFGGFAGWTSVPAAMGGEPTFAGSGGNGKPTVGSSQKR